MIQHFTISFFVRDIFKIHYEIILPIVFGEDEILGNTPIISYLLSRFLSNLDVKVLAIERIFRNNAMRSVPA